MSKITNPELIFRAVNPDGSLEGYTEQNDNLYSTASCSQTIAGGSENYISGNFHTIGGGKANFISESDRTVIPYETEASVIAGGQYNCSAQSYNVIGGGCFNNNAGAASVIGGGVYNCIRLSTPFAFIGGGCGNVASKCFSVILGGFNNLVGYSVGGYSAIIGAGGENSICAGASTILGSFGSKIYSRGTTRGDGGGSNNLILGGSSNIITGLFISSSTIIGAGQNCINNANNATIIGSNSLILSGHHYAMIISDGNYYEEWPRTRNSSGPNTFTVDFSSGTYIRNKIIFQNDNYAPSNHTSFGISGQISYDKNYLYRHNGDNWTKVQMGTGDNLFLTGSALVTANRNYSGWASNTYGTVSNLFSTGSVLATYNTNYSGWAKNTYATADNLFLTGSNIVATRITGVSIQDEGSNLAQAKTLNFVGAGVSASVANAIATITIAGGGGGGNVSYVSVPTTPTSAGSNGQIATDSRYFYSHDGSKWRRTALAEW
jgi:hypothetical protein